MENVVINNSNGILSTFERVKKYKEINLERVGETNINCSQGEIMFIIEYNSSIDVTVQFQSTGEIINNCKYQQFKSGLIRSHYSPSVYGVGIKGIEPTKDANGNTYDSYSCWSGMLARCYNAKYKRNLPTYDGVTVCKEWIYYSNFKKFYDENIYKVEGQTMELDKDILHKGNKLYSPENCVFVPHAINSLFTKRQNDRGDCPIGVTIGNGDKIIAACRNSKGIKKYLGQFETKLQAFNAYKKVKEKTINEIADIYKTQIPAKLYVALVNYKVSIED